MAQFSGEKTLLYVHGTTHAASSTFDLPLNGLSWMDYIALRGYDVYLVDVRGYVAPAVHLRWRGRLLRTRLS
jgi:hypothetical protein